MAQQKENNNEELVQNFKRLCEQVSLLGAQVGKEIFPYRDPSLSLFRNLELEQQKSSLQALRSYVKVCEETVKDGYDLESLQLVWFALSKMKLKPPSNLFEFLKREDVIEIHDFEGIQTFRNFNFYDYCSYTLEELYTYPWTSLFYHHQLSMKKVIDFTVQVAKGEITAAQPMKMEPHLSYELHSEKKVGVKIQFKYGSPLFDEGKNPVATLTAESLELLTRAEVGEVISAYSTNNLQVLN